MTASIPLKRRIVVLGSVLLAAMYATTGLSKLMLLGSLGICAALGVAQRDPTWLVASAGVVEILLAAALLIRPTRRVGLYASAFASSVFCAYHIILGLGFGSPT